MTRHYASKTSLLGFLLSLTLSVSALAQSGQKASPQEDRLRIETKLVSLTVTVRDKNRRFVAGLTKDDFEVFEDKVRQEIAIFRNDDSPLTLGIIYDVSGSMSDLTHWSFSALRRLFEYAHSDDEYFIIGFNDRTKLIHDFTSATNEILNRVVFMKSKGSTALYDAVYSALEKVRAGRHEKKAILIISDGMENSSRYSWRELKNALRETDAQIYAIGQGAEGATTLESISATTGGLTFFPYEESEVTDVYTRIALMLRHQYILAYYPTNSAASSRWRKVKVTAKGPRPLGKLQVFYRDGYQPTPR
jgi:Ca-activated chloride channel family protein